MNEKVDIVVITVKNELIVIEVKSTIRKDKIWARLNSFHHGCPNASWCIRMLKES